MYEEEIMRPYMFPEFSKKSRYDAMIVDLELFILEIIESYGLKLDRLTSESAEILGVGRPRKLQQALYILTSLGYIKSCESGAALAGQEYLELFHELTVLNLKVGFEVCFLDPDWCNYEERQIKSGISYRQRAQKRADNFQIAQ